MYAIIRAGGKQHKVTTGDVIEVERLKSSGETVEFTPLLVVDDRGEARAGKSDLARVRVTAKVLGDAKGPKTEVVKFRSKSGYRRRTGHRQKYTTLQISDVRMVSDEGAPKRSRAKKRMESDGT